MTFIWIKTSTNSKNDSEVNSFKKKKKKSKELLDGFNNGISLGPGEGGIYM